MDRREAEIVKEPTARTGNLKSSLGGAQVVREFTIPRTWIGRLIARFRQPREMYLVSIWSGARQPGHYNGHWPPAPKPWPPPPPELGK